MCTAVLEKQKKHKNEAASGQDELISRGDELYRKDEYLRRGKRAWNENHLNRIISSFQLSKTYMHCFWEARKAYTYEQTTTFEHKMFISSTYQRLNKNFGKNFVNFVSEQKRSVWLMTSTKRSDILRPATES